VVCCAVVAFKVSKKNGVVPPAPAMMPAAQRTPSTAAVYVKSAGGLTYTGFPWRTEWKAPVRVVKIFTNDYEFLPRAASVETVDYGYCEKGFLHPGAVALIGSGRLQYSGGSWPCFPLSRFVSNSRAKIS